MKSARAVGDFEKEADELNKQVQRLKVGCYGISVFLE